MTHDRLQALLSRFASARVGVLGDFFVDQYLMIDPNLAEPSLETGLDAHQVVDVRCQPGAAGTITNNLAALGVGAIIALGFSGSDGPGYELRRGLRETGVRLDYLLEAARHTPTYTKPLVLEPGRPPRELNRLDLKNREATPAQLEAQLIAALSEAAAELDALIVLDQVEARNTGAVTDVVRAAVADLARRRPELVVMADSRRHIALFREVMLKPNVHELGAALGIEIGPEPDLELVGARAMQLAGRQRRPVLVTLGERGVLAAEAAAVHHVEGVKVAGPTDIVGAGDSFCAAATTALAAGGTLVEAAECGCLVASITVQQIGTTGTASPAQVLARLAESPYGATAPRTGR